MPTSLYPLLDTLQLFYDTEACLLICTQESCKFALSNSPSQVVAHLRDKHNVPTEARNGLHRLLKSLSPTLLDPNKAPLPADGSARHDKLQVYEGFACLDCPFRTISIQLMRRHQSSPPEDCSSGVSHTRAVRRRDLDQQFECVYLQTWTTGSTRKYWIIKQGGSIVRQFNRGKLPNEMTAAPPVAPADTTAFALQTPWLERTGWDRTYNNKDRREVLTALTRTFVSPGGREHHIGHGQQYGLDKDLVSPGEDEDRIACLIRLVDVMICRCEETARKTSRHMLCWLRSTKESSIYSKPFTLVQPSSSTKYRLLLKRCLAMVLRIYRLPPDKRLQVTGLALNRKQLQFLDAIWTHEAFSDLATLEELAGRYKRSAGHTQAASGLGERSQTTSEGIGDDYKEEEEESEEDEMEDEENEEEEEDSNNDNDKNHSREGQRGDYHQDEDGGFTTWLNDLGEITDEEEHGMEVEGGAAPGSPEELVELLFGLTLALATQPVVNGQPQKTVMIYFSGILGFSSSPDGSAFLPARSYTSNLSGLVYILRLIFLEYALPLQAYPTLAFKRRPRVGQLERLQSIRRQYMVMESQSPMEELLSLRNYGQVMSRTDTPPHLLRWSDNGQVVSLGDEISISMSQFRRLPDHFIAEAARLCDEMMFSWDPAIDLSNISDNMANNKEGFSFVLHPENKLDTAYLQLFDRASKAHRNGLFRGNGWDWKAVFQNFKNDEALLSAILGGMFCTGGQLPRCTEMLTLLCCNSELHPRGIYVYDQSIVYIIRHHKAKRATNHEFVVARFLPAQLGHILYKYLVYVRPFINMLHRERGSQGSGQATESPLLFREDATLTSKSWQTGRLTAIIKTSTSLVWGQPINSRQFRQICIGITEKHVREVHESFNRFDDRSVHARRNVAFAWQSGHRPLQRASTYGLDGAFPTKLQPQLLELYRWASSRWHEFLHLPSFLKHTPRVEDPFKWNARSIPPSGPQVREGNEGREASTPLVILSSPSPSDQASIPDAPESTLRRSLTQPIISPSSTPSTYRRTVQQQRSMSSRHDRPDDPSREIEESEREHQEMMEFFRRIQEEDEEILNRESRQQDQPGPNKRRGINLPSKKRSDHQRQGSRDISRPLKRKRTLPPSFRGLNIQDQSPGNDTRRHWPLFGHPGGSTTTSAINKRQAILNHLNDQATIKKGDEDYKVQMKLRCKVGTELEKWATVGCQLCYVLGNTGLDHNLENCTAAGSEIAQRLLRWLETLHLERYAGNVNHCSLCTETDQICEDIAIMIRRYHAKTEEEKDHWTEKYMSATGPDGFCDNKPSIRRTIAALCTVDDQILGKALTSFISKTYDTDLTLESQAAKWFEEKVPLGETWVPQLLVAFDLLVRAFELVPRNAVKAGRDNGAYDSSPSGLFGVPTLQMSWGDSKEVSEWKIVMDWWMGKCSFCAGRGVQGPQIEHTLRQCPHGGKQVLKSELAEAIYEEGFRARGGCRRCALPREVCQAWEKDMSGEWCFHPRVRCQYGSQAYDTAIGFFFCKNSHYRIELMESMSEEGLNDLDEESVAEWLGKKIVVMGVEA
ncbi:hypothetical protein H9L39_18087 [Fusarium oxysporum f. sp. albedinis]|nr:hypothetical protein H9L39_18087 [Fusarium oxysporum f. sp. albedinis]